MIEPTTPETAATETAADPGVMHRVSVVIGAHENPRDQAVIDRAHTEAVESLRSVGRRVIAVHGVEHVTGASVGLFDEPSILRFMFTVIRQDMPTTAEVEVTDPGPAATTTEGEPAS